MVHGKADIDPEHRRPDAAVNDEDVAASHPEVETQRHYHIVGDEQRQAAPERGVERKGVEVDQRVEIGVTLRRKPADERHFRPLGIDSPRAPNCRELSVNA